MYELNDVDTITICYIFRSFLTCPRLHLLVGSVT